MKNLKRRFKTRKQLEATGWELTDQGGFYSYHHRYFKSSGIPEEMLNELEGKLVDIPYTKGWTIDPEMVVGESEIIQEILNHYD